MDQLLISTTVAIASLAGFFLFITALKYAVSDTFVRTRLIMTAFLVFMVITLTAAFWKFTGASLWYSIPALAAGMLVGHFVGVRAAQEKLMMQGLERYMKHFAHVDVDDEGFQWWSVINFYSIAAALLIINLLGLTTVLYNSREGLVMATCALGAFLMGTLTPYLIHLWSIKASENKSKTTSER
ncbi:MAG: hypothetical protein JWO43_360 [Candidatus Adlerbacteria bacterium]|nr:hypothetical protein [Candidatus Adlerbacteria bacterium]